MTRTLIRTAIGLIVVAVLVASSACTDAQRGKIGAFGDSASVKCWSGGQKIFEGQSSGKVSSEENSDGYFFRDAADGKFKEVSGNCVIAYGDSYGD